jgi:phosphotransferase system HPr (HPr) family protein
MNGEPLERTVVINNPHGFHLRPMSTFVQTAARYQSDVKVSCDGRTVDGKSMFDLMTLAAGQGSALTVQVAGPDAPVALDALVAVLQAPFAEDDAAEPPMAESP